MRSTLYYTSCIYEAWYIVFMIICSATRVNHQMGIVEIAGLYVFSLIAIAMVYLTNYRPDLDKKIFSGFLFAVNTTFFAWNYEIWKYAAA